MTALWWIAAVAVTVLSGWLLYDAGTALVDGPSFDAVLRLVVEAVAGVVVIAFCVGKARGPGSATPDDGGGGGAGEGQEREAGQPDRP